MSVTRVQDASPFLYQTQLGKDGIATVSVTHNAGCLATRYAGNLGLHVGDDSTAVLARRAVLENDLGKPIQWLSQVHGVAVHEAHTTCLPAPTADAVITQSRELAIAVMSADCLPVAFTAQNAAGQVAIALAHAGWRGLAAGVLQNTLRSLRNAVPNAQIYAHLAPCIGAAQFEVGNEVRQAFIAQHAGNQLHFTAVAHGTLHAPNEVHKYGAQKYLCDLEGLARAALHRAGAHHISGGGWCTLSDPRLASYRRAPTTGRFATVLSLNSAKQTAR